MTTFKKTLLGAAAAMALAAPAANAALINVGGVVWDPDHLTDFDADVLFTQWFSTTDVAQGGTPSFTDVVNPTTPPPVGSYLTGVGEVSLINGLGINTSSGSGGDPTSFCPGCELTFSFGGIKLLSISAGDPGDPPLGTPIFDATNAWLDVYVDTDLGNPAKSYVNSDVKTNGQVEVNEATDGVLWLSLKYDAFAFQSGTLVGGLTESFLSVVGGLAQGNFNTNFFTLPVVHDLESINNAFFTGSCNLPGTIGGCYANGTGDLFGSSIPEPATLALLGIGLLGIGGMSASRKRAKA